MFFVALCFLVSCCWISVSHGELVLLEQQQQGEARSYTVIRNATGRDLTAKTVAHAVYNDTLLETGWDYLYIAPNRRYWTFGSPSDSSLGAGDIEVTSVSEAYRAAGYLEGYVTAHRIWNYFVNQVQSVTGPSMSQEKEFIEKHIAYMESLMASSKDSKMRAGEPAGFIEQLAKIWAQLEGLYQGYNQYLADAGLPGTANASDTKVPQPLSFYRVFLFSYLMEVYDVQTFLGNSEFQSPAGGGIPGSPGMRMQRQHCSALIKPVEGENGTLADMYVSQAAWSTPASMMRMYKIYDFGPDSLLSFSSYPGVLASADDWYMTSKGLAVQETTIGVYNASLYTNKTFTPDCVSEWLRSLLATYLSHNGSQWTDLYVYQNSGTYNNQWMVVDMNLFKPGSKLKDLPDGILWLAETLPGIALRGDVSHVLRKQGYWASYNMPYFKEIFHLTGTYSLEQQFGTFFSYTKYARPMIFARNQTMVKDLDSMKALMRYNNYKHDPLSRIPNCTGTIYGNDTCKPPYSAMLSIGARGDLDPPANASTMGILAEFYCIGQQLSMEIDAKIATWGNIMNGDGQMKGYTISGPSNDPLPTFSFHTAPSLIQEVPHQGLPDTFDFSWQTYQLPPKHLQDMEHLYNLTVRESGERTTGTSTSNDKGPGRTTPFATSSGMVPLWARYQAFAVLPNGTRIKNTDSCSRATGDLLHSTFDYRIELFSNSVDNCTLALIEVVPAMAKTGWEKVTVSAPNTTDSLFNMTERYAAAGTLEGYLTAQGIHNDYVDLQSASFAQGSKHAAARQWVQSQYDYIKALSEQTGPTSESDGIVGKPSDTDTDSSAGTASTAGEQKDGPKPSPGNSLPRYIQQLKALLKQIDGLTKGYQLRVANSGPQLDILPLTWEEMYYISFQAEIWDVETFLWANSTWSQSQKGSANPSQFRMGQHCTALIKPTDEDLYLGHTTWASLNSMLRQYKTYNFETTVSMSSYPGMIVSSDDWYITSNGMAITETTNPVYTFETYKNGGSTQTVPAFLRAMLASFLATNGREWVSIFTYKNSGTYNNQWMAVDMKLYQPGIDTSVLPDGLLWVTETLPGMAPTADVTSVVRSQGYWASYNIPYFSSINKAAGYPSMKSQYGSFFSYSKYARPMIFARNHTVVKDLDSMKALMRYNNYKHDPLSRIPNCTGTIYGNDTCKPPYSAMLSIAVRGDLDPVGNASNMGPLATLKSGVQVGEQNEAAIDCKIASYRALFQREFSAIVISGPTTYNGQPVFAFASAPQNIQDQPRLGVPEQFDFPWQNITASGDFVKITVVPPHEWSNLPPSPSVKSKIIVKIVVGCLGGVLLFVNVMVFVRYRRRKSESQDETKNLVNGGNSRTEEA